MTVIHPNPGMVNLAAKYASLNSIMDSCRSALLDNGVLLTQYPVSVEGDNLGLVTKLIHAESGQYQASLAIIPLAKPDAQAMGSAFTYGRRYALSSMLGIITGEDDDGNAASYGKNGNAINGIQTAQPARRIAPKKVSSATRVTLSSMLEGFGLADLLPAYRAYLRSEYGCTTDKISVEQYEEQKAMLEKCKKEPLSLRNFMRTLHEFK